MPMKPSGVRPRKQVAAMATGGIGRGKPVSIRSDNGPEYISGTLKSWAERNAIRLNYISAGKSATERLY